MTIKIPLTGEQQRLVNEDARLMRLLNAGIQSDGSYVRGAELQAIFEREDARDEVLAEREDLPGRSARRRRRR